MSNIYNKSYRESLVLVNSHNDYLKEMLKVEDKLWWSRASQKNTQRAYEDYLVDYPNGIYKLEAKEKIAKFIAITKEKERWNATCQRDTQKAYESYLSAYPNGMYVKEAKRKIDKIIEIERKKQLAIAKEKERWKTACQKNTQRDYESYLFNYPNGIYTLEAKRKVDKFIAITKEKECWSATCQKNTQKAYENYLSEYINGTHALEAKQKIDEFIAIEIEKELERKRLAEITRKKEEERLAELKRKKELAIAKEKEYWKTLYRKNTQRDYEDYLSTYPNGIYTFEAKKKIDEFIAIEREKKLERKRLAEIERKKEEERLTEIARKKEEFRLVEIARKEEETRLAEVKNAVDNYIFLEKQMDNVPNIDFLVYLYFGIILTFIFGQIHNFGEAFFLSIVLNIILLFVNVFISGFFNPTPAFINSKYIVSQDIYDKYNKWEIYNNQLIIYKNKNRYEFTLIDENQILNENENIIRIISKIDNIRTKVSIVPILLLIPELYLVSFIF